jgi:AraC-like DNA-binding protein
LKEQPAGYRFSTEAYDHFQVIFIVRGTLHFTTSVTRRVLSAGEVLVLRIGSAFRLSCPQQAYRGVCVNVFGACAEEFSGEAVAALAAQPLADLAHAMLREIRTPAVGTDEVLTGLGIALCRQALRQVTGTPAPEDAARYWAERARQALLATLTTGRGVREVLAAVPLSYRQLTRHFIEQTGLSPKQFQQQARLEEVKRLLATTPLPITTIAYETGYPSSQHLSSLFHRYTGLTPLEYRRSMLQVL